MNSIREKVANDAVSDPVISAVAEQFKLTRREAEILRYLRKNAGNDVISGELYLSDETVRTHVRNLMKKLSIEKRQDVNEWLEAFAKQC